MGIRKEIKELLFGKVDVEMLKEVYERLEILLMLYSNQKSTDKVFPRGEDVLNAFKEVRENEYKVTGFQGKPSLCQQNEKLNIRRKESK